ncbi:unannotated protein [freshwater metagenome]|uniref:Unannotated protein n=1 Tax=freshwater metagenome TaxID=449393 RepID=A0A6J6LRF9_9ZZZZ
MWVKDSARDQLEFEYLSIDDDRVASIVPTLISNAEGSILGEVIGKPPLAFISPLGTNNYSTGHVTLLNRRLLRPRMSLTLGTR